MDSVSTAEVMRNCRFPSMREKYTSIKYCHYYLLNSLTHSRIVKFTHSSINSMSSVASFDII